MIRPEALIEKFKYMIQYGWGYIWGTAGEKWTEAKQAAIVKDFVTRYGDDWQTDPSAKKQNKYNAAMYGNRWVNHIVADCSGAFSWAFDKLGGKMYHGSNTMYDSWCTAKGPFKNGKRTDGAALKPGTALFTGDSTNRGHVGLYIGDGWVIEAQGTKAGVVKSKASLAKWTWWGELKGVDYSEKESTPVSTVVASSVPSVQPVSEAAPVLAKEAKVVAGKGTTVKMRKNPSASCRLYDDVPVGATVKVDEYGETWSRISYGYRKGWYMMSQYLEPINS